MQKFYTLILMTVLSLSIQYGKGQELPPIQLDRPDQTECPFIVPAGFLQAENGFTFEKADVNTKIYSFPSILWKYGVNERFELRLVTELTQEVTESTSTTGLVPVTIGFKSILAKEHGIIPQTAFIGHLTTSGLGAGAFHTRYLAPSFRLTMQHTLTGNLSLGYNFGAEWDGETAIPVFLYTLTTGISLSQKIGSYLELYGFFPDGQHWDHRFDTGFTWLINRDLMVDISGGAGIPGDTPDYFLSLGFSYRFNLVKVFSTR